MFKIKATHRNDCPSSFWVKGNAEQPKIGNIYTQKKDATDFTADEVLAIILKFSKNYTFKLLT
jgi:hypothetical protein